MPGINRMSTNERIRMFAAYQGNNPMLKRAARDARKLLANPNPHWRRMLNEDLH